MGLISRVSSRTYRQIKKMGSEFYNDSTQVMLKDYHWRVKQNIKTMRENYQEILTNVEQSLESAAQNTKDKGQSTGNKPQETAAYASQTGHDEMVIQIRAANIVRAAHKLLDLTAELKTLVIISDLSSTHSAKETSLKAHKDKSDAI